MNILNKLARPDEESDEDQCRLALTLSSWCGLSGVYVQSHAHTKAGVQRDNTKTESTEITECTFVFLFFFI